MIKSFEEIKKIIEKFPEASGVGYAIAPLLFALRNSTPICAPNLMNLLFIAVLIIAAIGG